MIKLTVQHCLVALTEEELREFEALYQEWNPHLPSLTANIHNEEDALATVLNCWKLLRRYPKVTITKVEKNFSHQYNFYFMDKLDASPEIPDFLNRWQHDSDRLFVLSYYLGLHFMRWIDFVLIRNNAETADEVFNKNQKRHYYLLSEQELQDNADEALYIQQRLITSLLARDDTRTNRFSKITEQAINQAAYTIETHHRTHHG
ncbi:MAG: hypothetical protein ACI33P_08585 [Lysinibacillus sp.]